MILNTKNLTPEELNKLKFKSGFIVLDGPNGAGKSTLQKKISDYLNSKGKENLLTREPGGTETGKKIREILLNQIDYKLEPFSEIYLFCADRTEHINKVILPALKENKIVISDRYYYSTIAFQAYGRKLNLNDTKCMVEKVVENCLPDLTFILDVEPKTGLQRTTSRNNNEIDSFESEKIEFHQNLRTGFLELAKNCKENCVIIDANKDAENVWMQVKQVIDIWLN